MMFFSLPFEGEGVKGVRLTMNFDYTHQELDKEVHAMAGFYTPAKEVRLKYTNRDILYIVGEVVIDSSCCGTGSWTYAMVPGYIIDWQNRKNETGLPVSEVEPISDGVAQEDIRQIIKEAESISQIEFW